MHIGWKMAEARQKLIDGIGKVCALRTAKTVTETCVDEAWAALKTGILVARKDEEAFDARSEQEIRCVLEFLSKRGTKKKASRGQVVESLKIVLSRPAWLEGATQGGEELRASLKDLLAGNDELVDKLYPPPPPPEVQAVPDEVPEESCTTTSDREPPKITRASGIKPQLRYGFGVMKQFNWEFPHDPLGTKLDDATEGFSNVHDAVTALTTNTGKASVGGDVAGVIAEFKEEWSGILKFLLSMYNSGVRMTYSSRIKFVIINLRAFSSGFCRLMPWESLPWGAEEMPPHEAEDRKKFREEEDYRLACELRAEEDAIVQAEEEDWRIAVCLHDRLNHGIVTRAPRYAA